MSAILKMPLTRRAFIGEMALVGAAVGVAATIPGEMLLAGNSPALRQFRREVISFHMDQPYIDATGTGTPYHPPRGARSAEPMAQLSEETFRRAHCYV